MPPTVRELSEQAKSLPDAEKLQLVDELLAQVDAPDPEIALAWAEEVERRIEADKQGLLQTISYEEVMARYRRP